MDYKSAIDYINDVTRFGSRPGLERITELCKMLGEPQDSVDFVHIAGTNGKGSVCAMLSSVLMAAGLKTGVFTSPHISFIEERIKVDGKPIPRDRLADIIGKIKACTDKMEDKPTEFEIFTAAAFLYFEEEKCDIAVLETGLGGRLDSTNIIKKPLLSVITGIALDHTAILGSSVKEIATEKAGIIKENCPVLIADCPDEAKEVFVNKARKFNCEITVCDRKRITKEICSLSGSTFDMFPYGEVSVSLAGTYQTRNALLAVTAAEILKKSGKEISESDIKKGLALTVWPARFEILSKNPLIIYDGAHNPQGAGVLAENIKRLLGKKVILVMGVMADKDYNAMVKALSPEVSLAFTVKPEGERALSDSVLKSVFESFSVEVISSCSPAEGVLNAINAAKEKDLPIIVCGSLYMYSDVVFAIRTLKTK